MPITDGDRLRTVMVACSAAQVLILGITRDSRPFGRDVEPGWWIPKAEIVILNHVVDMATQSAEVLQNMAQNLWLASLEQKTTGKEGARPTG